MTNRLKKISMACFVGLLLTYQVIYPRAHRVLGIASGLCALAWLVSSLLDMWRLAPRERHRAMAIFVAVIAISSLILIWVVRHP